MSIHVYAGSFPSSASPDQFRQMRSTQGEIVSESRVDAESPDRFRGLGALDRPDLMELDLVETESQHALLQAPSATPVWANGTLPGMMAGRRPAPKLIGSY